ncbi:MAG: purine-nucleoside phosphorylase [Bacteroidales bacterium]|nr:purine-nucleoside phosphorylase [Bacteroidales bacterium]
MLKKIKKSVNYIQAKAPLKPQIGIILGTGLGGLTKEINIKYSIPYTDIPNFPESTVEGHQGKLIFGTLSGKNVVAMQGRFHFYEGYNLDEVTFPIRVLKYLGIELLILSNASGGLNHDFEVGDIMIIADHINLVSNPLIGKNETAFGPRFVDMSEAYNKKIISKATKIARHNNIKYQTGIYACVSGPTYETPAEYKYIQLLGADAVGMSTVPEVIVARHMNLTCFAISVISDLGVPGKIIEITHNDVIDAASHVEPKMTLIIKELIESI